MNEILIGNKYQSQAGLEIVVMNIRLETKGKRNILISYFDQITEKLCSDLVSALELNRRYPFYSGFDKQVADRVAWLDKAKN